MHDHGGAHAAKRGPTQIDFARPPGASKRRGRRPPARVKGRFFANWRVRAVFALGCATLAGSALLAASIAAPQAPLAALSPLAGVHDARAKNALSGSALTRSDLDEAQAESRAALRLAAVDNAAWLNLALIDRIRHGRLTAEGLQALRRSYGVAPFDPDAAIWRIRFALNNWDVLTPELRQDVTDEFRSEWPHARPQLSALQGQVSSTSGMMALSLMLALSSTHGPPAV